MNPILELQKDNIQKAKRLKPQEIIAILEDFRVLSKKDNLTRPKDKTILISLKVQESLLSEFKKNCSEKGLKYQTHIKELMKEWLKK